MRSRLIPDFSSLARLAQNPAAELRPLLLRVQVREFAATARRDAATVARFEAIALGLMPLVEDDALAEAAALLRQLPETPASVLAELASRLGCGASDRAEADQDLVRARDPGLLAGHELALLVGRARERPLLASALLARSDLTAFDRARLYRHAEPSQRDEIRGQIAKSLPPHRLACPAAPATLAADAMRAATDGTIMAFVARAGEPVGLAADARFRLDSEAERELFICGLLAIGLDPDGCIGVALSIDVPSSRCVPSVFRLAAVARTTPRPAAIYLAVGARQGSRGAQTTSRGDRVPTVASGLLMVDGRSLVPLGSLRPSPRASDPSVHAGHR